MGQETVPRGNDNRYDMVIVGAGFAGLYMLYKARQLGLTAVVFEEGEDVGGTWYWNRYPGARCDIESLQYSYSFSDELEHEWRWTERYASQPEILRYIRFVAEKFGLYRDIRFGSRVAKADFDEAGGRWRVAIRDGEVSARFLVMATGALSASQIPPFPGLGDFRGETFHTGKWPHHPVDFHGKTVGVVGTGSSGVQAIPEIAKAAKHLFVFQRTPPYSVPARNEPLDDAAIAWWRENYPEQRRIAREEMRNATVLDVGRKSALEVSDEEREREFADRWRKGGPGFMYAYNDLVIDEAANRMAADFVRARIRETVRDQKVAATLSPADYPIGTKRICIDTDYFATYNRDNVTLVDLRSTPIEAVTPAGIRTTAEEYPLDAIVFATGYDALTGALTRIDIRGLGGALLREKWQAGPRTYLGLMTAGFPNLFLITGPGSPSVLSNVVRSIEQHVEWVSDLLRHMMRAGIERVDAETEAEDRWVAHCSELATKTLHRKADSWYLGANIPGKPRVFMPYIGGTNVYRRTCDEIAAAGYPGFKLTKKTAAAA